MIPRFTIGEWKVAPDLNTVESGQRTVRLEPKVMQVLVALSERPGDVVSKEEIFRRVWPDAFVSDEVLTRSISELRKVFGDAPHDPKYIQTISKGGYRLVAPFVADPPATAAILPVDPPAAHAWKQNTGRLAAVTSLILLAALAFFVSRRTLRPPASAARVTSLVVLPLTNLSGDAAQDYFSDGMTDELTTRLANLSALRVISRTSAMHYKGTQKTVPQIARELNVDAVIEGSVLRSGDRVRISAQLILALADKHLWAESYERDLRDVLALQSDVARAVAREIKIQITPQEDTKLTAVRPVDPEAHDSYLKGLFDWEKFTEETMWRAVGDFQHAIEKQPDYAPAYAGLANTYHELAFYVAPREVMPKAKQAAMRALELDPTDAEARAALGWIKWHYDWDWSGAEQEYARAIESNPTSGMAHGQYALFLDALGRFSQALREHEISQGFDPLSLVGKTNLADSYFLARRFADAEEQYRRVLAIDANFVLSLGGLGTVYIQQGKLPDAIAQLQRATELDTDPGYAGTLGYAFAQIGDEAKARKIIAQLLERSRKTYVSPTSVALVYLGLGEKGRACDWLERGYLERDSNLADIGVDPLWDKLRPSACFKKTMQRIAPALTPERDTSKSANTSTGVR